MEEKERYYSLIDHNGNFTLRDYETGNELTNLFDLDDLLNQQDKRIKELEQEKQQLKQQLHDLPKKIVEEIRIELNNIVEVGDYFDTETDEETNLLKQSDIENILDAILEKFGDKNEINND